MRVRVGAVLDAWLRFISPRRLRTYPAVVLTVMLVAAAVYAVFVDTSSFGADFRAFYTAGTFLRMGRGDLLYDFAATARFQTEVLGARGVSAWLSPPYWAWPFVPLSRLPFRAALLVHSAIGLASAALALTLLARELGVLKQRDMAWAAVTYYPTLQWFTDGQTTSFWALILVAVFVMLRRGRDGWAGLFLGCFALKPQLALGLVVALLGARRWRALAAAALSAGVWVGVGYLTLPGAMHDYWGRASEFGSFLRSDGYPTAGLHGLFQMGPLALEDFSPGVATVVGAILTALALAALAALWVRAPWRPGETSWNRRMAATFALSIIASPHLFGYDLVLLLIPFFVVWAEYPEGTDGRPLDGGALLGATALAWALALLGPALTLAQQWLTKWSWQRSVAVQIEAPVFLWWIWLALRPASATQRW